ncbi:hypothetical protein TRM7557_02356 [Tritonibacter multivorans]|uniref:DUF2125 domain-containing protein n=1 Tax=Tritonibacter multivorans TaxID=928856 RepID=A0A0P1GDI7_9RHOB|nr:DUF2125 domain-containing protein [Tritonibacter multivorans]MDA7419938.1 DUF2125 domain-containing protein [Tritonibacter multivorans]CUH79359.1 hypothetical protein TRM7557_02356 [Tritonibacter multivorans]SFC11059.1 hypothetical protein SAMN04488049_101362 [Tritonibacter multivorans]
MSVFFPRGLGLVSGAISPLLLVAHAAHADVSAQDVWADWKSYMVASGYEITANESLAAGILTITDFEAKMTLPETEGFAMSMVLGDMRFEEMGDGTVNIQLPADFPMDIAISEEGEGGVSLKVAYTHDGAPIVVSGDPEAMVYDYSTDKATFALSDLQIEDAKDEVTFNAFEITFNDLESRTTQTKDGDNRSYDQSFTSESVTYTVDVVVPEDEGSFKMSGDMADFAMTSDSVLPMQYLGNAAGDFSAALNNGMAYRLDANYGANTSNLSVEAKDGSFVAQGEGASGLMNLEMTEKGLNYRASTMDMTNSVMGSDIPFPMTLSIAEAAMNLAMPLLKSDDEQDFAFGLSLRDFQVPDLLWGMVDPTGQLPHDPATFVLDLTGKAKLLFNFDDEEEMAALEKGELTPGELNAITVNELRLSAVGAEVSGTGDFTFNNDDLQTFDGLPAPNGEANFKIVGANTLIDKLIAMGLVQESDALGARMMMGLFTTPAEGEDTLTSRIQVEEDGKVLANGQRLR